VSAGRGRDLDPPAIELVEEAVHLLRRAPAGWFALYLVGSGPFVVALLFFWAWATWARPPSEEVAWSALGLVPLFLWMKAIQSECCARLLCLRLDTAPAPLSVRRLARLLVAQARVQTWVAVLLGPALLLVLPFAWVFAYGQSATVIGEGEKLHDEAAAQAKLWPAQNLLGLSLIGALGACLTLNLGVTFYLVPWLGNRVLGIENFFSLGGWSMLNTTFVAAVISLGWIASDPVVKAFYVMRVFHGRSLRTGEDLRVDLKRARRAPALAVLALVLGLALAPAGATAPLAARAPPPSESVRPKDLDRSIDSVLARTEYAWRMHPATPVETQDEAKDGIFVRFVRAGLRVLWSMLRSLVDALRAIVNWILDRFGRPAAEAGLAAASTGSKLVTVLLYIFAGVAVCALLWLVWLVVRRLRAVEKPATVAKPLAAKPDLTSEDLQAAHLPVEGWLALAREQAARGDWRLAQRALYLALLASLASEGLLSLARFKTNLDYERELRGRALSRGEIPARFAVRRREFEDSWYGRVLPSEKTVRGWMAEFKSPLAQ
jgi:hypothetical protein